METKQFYSLLKSLDIPVAYGAFKHEVEFPYCVYLEEIEVYGDDFKNTIKSAKYTIELYDLQRNIELEEKLEKMLDEHGFEYSAEYGTYIDDDQSFMTVYYIEPITYKKKG